MARHSNKTNEKQVSVEEPKSVVDKWAEYSNEIHSYGEIKKKMRFMILHITATNYAIPIYARVNSSRNRR